MIWFGCTSNWLASSESVRSPRTAARATFALNSAEWLRRGRLPISRSCLREHYHALNQAAIPLIPLFRFPEPLLNFHSDAKRFGRVSDALIFYSKTDAYTFNRPRVSFSKAYIDAKFTHQDHDRRRFRLSDWNPPSGRGPVYAYHGITKAWRMTKEKMLALEAEGRIYLESTIPQLKRYLDELDGQAVHNIWDDIPSINPMAKERVGYPTQKPLALLERIIKASSNEGDVVLDPFCGCATACVAADRLDRRWVGIDISPKAVELVNMRLQQAMGSLFHHGYVTARTDVPQRTDIEAPVPYLQNKHVLFGRQEGLCGGCKVLFPFRNFTIDHVVPQSRGGTDHLGNLQLLCGACNSLKGDRTQEYLMARLSETAA